MDVPASIAKIRKLLLQLGENDSMYNVAQLLAVTNPTVGRWIERVHYPHKRHLERIELLVNLLTRAVNGDADAAAIFREISKNQAPAWLAMGRDGFLFASGKGWAVLGESAS
ncbi:MAG: hypothetical protein NUW37_06310 [Planctomycetes bacterium]|nr:hypothetical protein [Planctomycetota bacterium]